MSGTTAANLAATPGITPARRVRHDARDTLTVMLFSALASCGVAVLLALAVRLGN
jgi:hypothetical protein